MLEGIFTPFFRHRRQYRFPSDEVKSSRFIHYTSAEAALNIIKEKRLWLRSTACMDDYREVQHGFSILHNYFSNENKSRSFIHAVDQVAPGAAQEAISRFNTWHGSGIVQFQTFIASISEHCDDEDRHGRLSMWRAFGKTTARVGLVLNIPARSEGARAMNVTFSPVSYCGDDDADRMITEVIHNISTNTDFLMSLDRKEIVRWISTMLLINVTCVKHEGFKEEREWRVVYCPQLYQSTLITSSTQVLTGVPQIVYKLPIDKTVDPVLEDMDISRLFDRLIIGPSPYPVTMLDAFDQALTDAGVGDARRKIVISYIPIRS